MKKGKNAGEEFTRKANKLITLTSDEAVIEILSLMKEEFDELEDEKSEFINTIDDNIDIALDKLAKEMKKEENLEVVSDLLREVKINLVKRYNLVSSN